MQTHDTLEMLICDLVKTNGFLRSHDESVIGVLENNATTQKVMTTYGILENEQQKVMHTHDTLENQQKSDANA